MVDTLHVFDDGFGLLFREHGWDVFGFGGAEITDDGFVQFDLQDIAIEKQDGAEGLVLGRSRDFLFDRQVGGELVDFGSAHFARMAFVAEGLLGGRGYIPLPRGCRYRQCGGNSV